jgi:AbiTii
MSFLKDIQDAAIDANADVIVLLRKCKVLAARLGNSDFKNWVEHELNGYPSKDELPEYRILEVQSYGNFSGSFGSGYKNIPIPPRFLSKEWRDLASIAYLTESISAYNALLSHDDGTIMSQWPADLLPEVKVFEDTVCYAAWRNIPRNSIVSLIDTIKNKILDFVLKIEEIAPKAGDGLRDSKTPSQEEVKQVFNISIMGNVGNLATGSSDFSQDQHIEVSKGDMDSLKKYLSSKGVANADISSLEKALEVDPLQKSPDTFGTETATL